MKKYIVTCIFAYLSLGSAQPIQAKPKYADSTRHLNKRKAQSAKGKWISIAIIGGIVAVGGGLIWRSGGEGTSDPHKTKTSKSKAGGRQSQVSKNAAGLPMAAVQKQLQTFIDGNKLQRYPNDDLTDSSVHELAAFLEKHIITYNENDFWKERDPFQHSDSGTDVAIETLKNNIAASLKALIIHLAPEALKKIGNLPESNHRKKHFEEASNQGTKKFNEVLNKYRNLKPRFKEYAGKQEKSYSYNAEYGDQITGTLTEKQTKQAIDIVAETAFEFDDNSYKNLKWYQKEWIEKVAKEFCAQIIHEEDENLKEENKKTIEKYPIFRLGKLHNKTLCVRVRFAGLLSKINDVLIEILEDEQNEEPTPLRKTAFCLIYYLKEVGINNPTLLSHSEDLRKQYVERLNTNYKKAQKYEKDMMPKIQH